MLIFWAVYRILTLVIAILRPDITTGLTALTHGVDDAAMCVVISYTANSATEKVAVQYFTAKHEALAKDKDKDNEEESDNG